MNAENIKWLERFVPCKNPDFQSIFIARFRPGPGSAWTIDDWAGNISSTASIVCFTTRVFECISLRIGEFKLFSSDSNTMNSNVEVLARLSKECKFPKNIPCVIKLLLNFRYCDVFLCILVLPNYQCNSRSCNPGIIVQN